MNVLAIDTATPAPAVAVLTGGRVHEEMLPDDRRASEDLVPAIEQCLRRAGLELKDCSRIAVCSGPGSFTGVRVGLATAWGLSRAAGAPVETVPTLEAMAETARRSEITRVAAALDAGRGELIVGLYSLEGARARAIGNPERLARAAAIERTRSWQRVALPGSLLGAAAGPPAESVAVALARCVARSPRESGDTILRAVYSRPSAAEEKLGAP